MRTGVVVSLLVVFAVLLAVASVRSPDTLPMPQTVQLRESPTVAARTEQAAAGAEVAERGASSPESVAPPIRGAQWNRRFEESDDHYAFVREAVAVALDGDGRAQWFLAMALLKCRAEVSAAPYKLPGPWPRIDPRCARFENGHPLDGFALPEEAKEYQYWRNAAYASADAAALVARAATAAVNVNAMTGAKRAQAMEQIMSDFRVALASKEPEVLLQIGGVFMSPTVASDLSRAFAWLLAACELGYDCGTRSFPGLDADCRLSGRCTHVTTITEFMTSGSYPGFARAYAAGLDIAHKVREGDWTGLQPHLQFKDP